MIRKAAEAAEREWREKEGGQGLAWDFRVGAPQTTRDRTASVLDLSFWKKETWEAWLDTIMETFFV